MGGETEATKAKPGKSDYIQFKNSCASKDTTETMKKAPEGMRGDTCTSGIPHGVRGYRMHSELARLSNNRAYRHFQFREWHVARPNCSRYSCYLTTSTSHRFTDRRRA